MSKMFAWLGVCAVLLAGSMAQAGTITVNFCDGAQAKSLVANSYNYNMVGIKGWVGTAPEGAGTINFTFSDFEPFGFLVGSVPDGWDNATVGNPAVPAPIQWTPLENTYGYAGNYSANNMGMSVTNIPIPWGTVTMDSWIGSYGPTGNSPWRGRLDSNNGTSTISTGNIADGGAFGAVSFTGANIPLPSVPEPSAFVLAGLGLAGLSLGALRKKFRRAALS